MKTHLLSAVVTAALLLVSAGSAAEPMRVACVGDSITHGVGAAVGWAWPDQLDRMLGTDWDVRGFGHSGATVGKADKHTYWNQKEYQAALAFRPDVVVIMLGTNDSKPENWKDAKEFAKLYRELIASFTRLPSQPKIFCCTPPFVPGKGNFGINEPTLQEQIPLIEKSAKAAGATLLDIHGATADQPKLFPDNVHPTTEGATVIARAVYQGLTGKVHEGAVPGLADARKEKPGILRVENPGALTYREAFGLMMADLPLTNEQRAKLKAKFSETAPVLEVTCLALRARAEAADSLRLKFKNTSDPDGQKLAADSKRIADQWKKDLDVLQRKALAELITLVPLEMQPAWAAVMLEKYVTDRLLPVALTLTAEQRTRIRDVCVDSSAAFARINNDYERATVQDDVFAAVVAKVLTVEQRKRI